MGLASSTNLIVHSLHGSPFTRVSRYFRRGDLLVSALVPESLLRLNVDILKRRNLVYSHTRVY